MTSVQPPLMLVTRGHKATKIYNRQLAYMVVQVAGERIVVVDGRAFGEGDSAVPVLREMLLNYLNQGEQQAPLAKAVLVWPDEKPAEFSYEFLQIIATTGEILPLEGTEAAAAAALFAQVVGIEKETGGHWQATNISTGQAVELVPTPKIGTDLQWRVKFNVNDFLNKSLQHSLQANHRIRFADKTVAMHLLLLDELYVFVNAPLQRLSKNALQHICDSALWLARKDAAVPFTAVHLLGYRIAKQHGVSVRYFNNSCEESEMPGFAVLLLASFLNMSHESSVDKVIWRVANRRRCIAVSLQSVQQGDDSLLVSCELTVSMRVLSCGKIEMPQP